VLKITGPATERTSAVHAQFVRATQIDPEMSAQTQIFDA
jgi:hypothetical protein